MSSQTDRSVLARGWSLLRTTGPRRSLAYARHLATERYHELRLGIRTAGPVKTEAVARRPGLCKPYAPIAYRSFSAVMREVAIRPGEDVFLDYGAGRGRAMLLAAQLPFRRVLGVEIDPKLVERARENIQRAGSRLRCRDLQVILGDAAEFGCPPDATVLHFFDPFAGPILEQVIGKIRESLRRAPRPLTILFADPNHFAPLAERENWLCKRCEVPYPFARGVEPIRESYYVYEARS